MTIVLTAVAAVEVAEVAVAVVEEDVVVVADAAVKKADIMKKIIIHTIPIAVSFFLLAAQDQICNPIILKGPEFLKFYLILLAGFYASVFSLKFFKETISGITFYFVIFILILGIIKLIRGLFLGKPVGFLIIILILEIIVVIFFILTNLKQKNN